MSEFLSGLLDRALDRAPVLERRRPALFEPLPWAGIRRDDNSAEQGEESGGEASEAPAPRRRRVPARANGEQRPEPINIFSAVNRDVTRPEPAASNLREFSRSPVVNPSPIAIPPRLRAIEALAGRPIETAPPAAPLGEAAAKSVTRPLVDTPPRAVAVRRDDQPDRSGITPPREIHKSKPSPEPPAIIPARIVSPPVVNPPLRPNSIVRGSPDRARD